MKYHGPGFIGGSIGGYGSPTEGGSVGADVGADEKGLVGGEEVVKFSCEAGLIVAAADVPFRAGGVFNGGTSDARYAIFLSSR